ncbi:hypothetical protein PLESTF_001676400 [Pleodorina starrii]|nr:hypothetical protein PLESTM_001548900 [Pleodorina starrii]GLC75712.1 hypothetical protein PLESTF_001676400 [Pleodorina starrii]
MTATSSPRRDITMLFVTRTVRMVAYGTIGVILALFLNAVGLSNEQLGILLTLTLLGDSIISLAVTRWADRVGRRFMLGSSCLLMIFAGVVYGDASRPSFALLLVAATLGVLSPSGNEVGPFLALEQSILAELVGPANRTHVFAWYNLVGYLMTALGALGAGQALTWAQRVYDISELQGYRAVFLQYGISGGVLLLLFALLTEQVERPERRKRQPEGKAPRATPGSTGTNGTAVQRDEESGLCEPLLGTPPEEEGPHTCDPPVPPEEGSGGWGPTSAPAGGSEPGGNAPGVAGSASPGGCGDGGGGGGGRSATEGLPFELADEVTADCSERYGSEAGGVTPPPPPHRAPSPPPPGSNARSSGGGDGDGCSGGGGSNGSAGKAGKVDCGGAAVGAMGLSVRSRRLVMQLSVLFATDSFAGGLVTGTLLAYYFQTKYGVSTAYLGGLLFGANLLAAVSSLASGFVAARIGLINTMVFTHLPSNVLLLAVPLMPGLRSATLLVFLRFSISQVPHQLTLDRRAALKFAVIAPK